MSEQKVTDVRMYVPDGHMEDFVMGLLNAVGLEPRKRGRGYTIDTKLKGWYFKQIRPQDQPWAVGNGCGDLSIVGEDIFSESKLTNLYPAENLTIIESLEGRPTRLVAVVSNERYGPEETLESILENNPKMRIASEYPYITKDWLYEKYGFDAVVYAPAGKTEALLIGGFPEADMVVDTTETGETIDANNCRIAGEIMSSKQVIIANTGRYNDPVIEEKIDNFVEQLMGVMRAKNGNLRKLQVNVPNPASVNGVVKCFKDSGYNPTVSNLALGGSDVYVVIPNKEILEITPQLDNCGCGNMAVTRVERLLYPSG